MDTNEHGCRKGTIYKETMKTGREGKTDIETGLEKTVNRRERRSHSFDAIRTY
jgi:hypothetical protein